MSKFDFIKAEIITRSIFREMRAISLTNSGIELHIIAFGGEWNAILRKGNTEQNLYLLDESEVNGEIGPEMVHQLLHFPLLQEAFVLSFCLCFQLKSI